MNSNLANAIKSMAEEMNNVDRYIPVFANAISVMALREARWVQVLIGTDEILQETVPQLWSALASQGLGACQEHIRPAITILDNPHG